MADEKRDYVAIANAFAHEAARDRSGKKHCKFVRQAAKRHLDDLKKKRWPYEFDEWHAVDVCDFIEKLPHIQGVWETATIQLEPAQVFILCVVFGWREKKTGLRRFKSVYIEMARKGAKSTLTAGVALYCLCCEDEPGPEIIIGATTGAQAKKVFGPAKKMVERTPALQEHFAVKAWANSISCGANDGIVQPINSKSSTQDGWNPHVGILDELHAHKDRGLFDVIKSAFGAREQPLLWIITTAGYNTAGVCYEQRQYVTKVLEGILEADHYFGIIFTLDEGDDPYDETKWIKANPMIGVTPKLSTMRDYARDAMASPASEGEFKTKRLNMWLNAASAWLNMTAWKKCADTDLDWSDFEGLECFIGGDLADKDDITAILLSAITPDDCLLIKPVFYLPEAVLEDAENSQGTGIAPYRAWRDQGFLNLTPGDWVDHDVIEQQIVEWIETFSVRHVTFDQFAAAQAMASRLNREMASPDNPIASILHKSAPNVTDPAKDLERRVKARIPKSRLIHDGNPIMTWMASNAVVTRHVNGSIIPKKESPMSPNKIDGIDAIVNAIAPVIQGEIEDSVSVYEDRGIRSI
ncbi:terminase large subunit [Nisaea nitritireducens]|uniref:terminase large subunit n=1 Tax=Nisaea nitritireducens TaxID=568392 RepID=UPI0018679B56|nr:terminase TerL endonuclease subunit [Nisaea nitritireducens]